MRRCRTAIWVSILGSQLAHDDRYPRRVDTADIVPDQLISFGMARGIHDQSASSDLATEFFRSQRDTASERRLVMPKKKELGADQIDHGHLMERVALCRRTLLQRYQLCLRLTPSPLAEGSLLQTQYLQNQVLRGLHRSMARESRGQ